MVGKPNQKIPRAPLQPFPAFDDNFKFDANGRKFFKRVENTVEKGEIVPFEHFLLFPQCFQKTCTANT